METLTRREFSAALTAACACLLCPHNLALADNVAPVAVGPLKDFAQDGIVDKWAKTHGFFLVRKEGKLYATSSICSHKQTAHLAAKPADHQFTCAAHGSRFSLDGMVIKGPAKRALPRYGISIGDDGTIIVDPSKRFDETQWEEAGSFIKAS
jgi:nitrite reductase/ring-hydroxylating ferredoxin subunit